MSATQGWGWMPGGRRWHYLVDARSLCHHWIDLRRRIPNPHLHPLQATAPESNRCQECVRKLVKLAEGK